MPTCPRSHKIRFSENVYLLQFYVRSFHVILLLLQIVDSLCFSIHLLIQQFFQLQIFQIIQEWNMYLFSLFCAESSLALSCQIRVLPLPQPLICLVLQVPWRVCYHLWWWWVVAVIIIIIIIIIFQIHSDITKQNNSTVHWWQ